MVKISFSNTRSLVITECEWKDLQIAILSAAGSDVGRVGCYCYNVEPYGCFDGAIEITGSK